MYSWIVFTFGDKVFPCFFIFFFAVFLFLFTIISISDCQRCYSLNPWNKSWKYILHLTCQRLFFLVDNLVFLFSQFCKSNLEHELKTGTRTMPRNLVISVLSLAVESNNMKYYQSCLWQDLNLHLILQMLLSRQH